MGTSLRVPSVTGWAQPSSQICPSFSLCLSDASAYIHVSSPMHSDQYLPGMPGATYVCLRIEDDCTGVPKVLHNKALLWCNYPPDTPCITDGSWLETGSTYPVSDGNFREVVSCIAVKHGQAIVEVAAFCNSTGGKWRVGVLEHASFLVSFPAKMVDMPIAKLPWQSVAWSFFTSCFWNSWCHYTLSWKGKPYLFSWYGYLLQSYSEGHPSNWVWPPDPLITLFLAGLSLAHCPYDIPTPATLLLLQPTTVATYVLFIIPNSQLLQPAAVATLGYLLLSLP